MAKLIWGIHRLGGKYPQLVKTVSKRRKVYRAVERLRANDANSVFVVTPQLAISNFEKSLGGFAR